MNFYGKDFNQDKLFVEIRNSLELAYWIASDNDHFVENFPEMIDKNILKIIYLNSSKLDSFLRETSKKISTLNGQHKKCATLLSKYIHYCVEECNFAKNQENKSESDDEKFSTMLYEDLSFREKFTKYYQRTDVEFYRSKAFAEFSCALSAAIDFTVYYEEKFDSTLAENKRDDVIRHLNKADRALSIGCRLMKADEASIKDFNLAYSGKSDKGVEDYYDLQVEFNSILKELFFVQKEFYTQLKNDEFSDLPEFDLYDHETKKYYGKMNIIGYEISKFILDGMSVDVPNFELLSPLTIEDQLDFIKVR